MEVVGTLSAEMPEAFQLALYSNQVRVRDVLENDPDGKVITSGDGVIRYSNPSARRLLGRPSRELIGHAFDFPVLVGESTLIHILQPSGRVRLVRMRASEVEWQDESAYLVTLRDVTRQRHLKRRLRRLVRRMSEADSHRETFLATLAHELRNPLAPILHAVRAMDLYDDDAAARKQAQRLVEHQVRNIARLVDDLMEVSRAKRGRITIRKERVDLATVLARAVEAARPAIDGRGQQLAVDPPAEPLELDVDPIWFEQVLVHLLTNASKYTDPGGSIHLSGTREGEDAVVRVRDNGIGIAPEMLHLIFDLFAQAEVAKGRSQGGLGIGLAQVRHLVELHAGRVHASSAGQGQGAEFEVRVPAKSGVAPDSVASSQPVKNAKARPLRILLIDDNVCSADILAEILRLWGHEVRVAYDGPEGMEEARSNRPDVVLLDIELPTLDGFAVARGLRMLHGRERLLLIGMSGHTRDEIRLKGSGSDFDHYLIKPSDPDVLKRLLDGAGPPETWSASVRPGW